MVYDPVVAVVAALHIGSGAAYFGASLVGNVLITKVLAKTETVGEWKAHHKLFRPITLFDAATSQIAFVTGLVFLAVKYPPFDLGTYASLPTTQPLLIAVGLFAFLVILNMTFMRKTVAAISGVSLSEDHATPVPDELMAAINRFAIGAHVQAAVMVTIIILMVIAANGGF